MKAFTIASVAVALLLASTSTADARIHLGPHQVRVDTGPWPELVRVARDYWAARGYVDTCPHTHVWVLRGSGPGEIARSDPRTSGKDGCDIAFNRIFLRDFRRSQHEALADPDVEYSFDSIETHGSTATRIAQASLLCLFVTHELGHNVGLWHVDDENAVMYAYPDQAPQECVQWGDANYQRFPWVTW